MKTLFLIDANGKCKKKSKKLSSIVNYVRNQLQIDNYVYHVYTVKQVEEGEDEIVVGLEEVMRAYEDGEIPQDLYFF